VISALGEQTCGGFDEVSYPQAWLTGRRVGPTRLTLLGMEQSPDLEARVSALEARMEVVAADASAARHLAAARDRDLADLGLKVDANRRVISALGEHTRAGFDAVDAKFVDVRAEMRAGFDAAATGFEQMRVGFAATAAGFDQIQARFAVTDARFDQMDARFTATDAGFERLESMLTRLIERDQPPA
jgi:hypothetical protein